MNEAPAKRKDLPRWVIIVASAAIAYHLIAITIPVLDAPSGPWATQLGRAPAKPPPFAQQLAGLATVHGEFLRVVHSYHFMSNRAGEMPGVKFEVHLKDAAGNPLSTLKFPDPKANPWIRHRQQLLASGLAPDLPVEMQGGEVLPAPGAKSPSMTIWSVTGDNVAGTNSDQRAEPQTGSKIELRMRTVPQHLVPRNRPVMRPSDWAVLLAKSYGRYLCRAHGAASAEVIRVTREPIPPEAMTDNQLGGQAFDDLLASFGEVSP